MNVSLARSLAISFAVVAAIALPSTVKAESATLSTNTQALEDIAPETGVCFYLVKYGWVCTR
jgi:hypothetical protein